MLCIVIVYGLSYQKKTYKRDYLAFKDIFGLLRLGKGFMNWNLLRDGLFGMFELWQLNTSTSRGIPIVVL